ncbi:MAG: peptide deformylase [Planctomycetota bacterium]
MTALQIVSYPHPTLRYKSKTIKRVDAGLKKIVAEMFQLMYEARGIGLAANQVGLPIQLFVINVSGDPDSGEELVFINPVISSPKGSSEAEEGCLSIVGVNADVTRPAQIHVSAYDLTGNQLDFTADGLLARAIQHEFDHLQGVLFIDRISESAKRQLSGELDSFELEFRGFQASGKVPDEQTIIRDRDEFEKRYC